MSSKLLNYIKKSFFYSSWHKASTNVVCLLGISASFITMANNYWVILVSVNLKKITFMIRCSSRSFAKIGPTSANIACECTTIPTLAQSCTCNRNQTPITQSICNVGPMIFAIWVKTDGRKMVDKVSHTRRRYDF